MAKFTKRDFPVFGALKAAVKKLAGSLEPFYRLATPDGAATLQRVVDIIIEDWRETFGHFITRLPFDPVAFIGEGWEVDETDERATALQSIDPEKIRPLVCLMGGEASIKGGEFLRRLKSGGNIRLDAGFFLALWREKGHVTLEWLFDRYGVVSLSFFGTILKEPEGSRCVLCLYRSSVGGGWHRRFCWLNCDYLLAGFSASLAA